MKSRLSSSVKPLNMIKQQFQIQTQQMKQDTFKPFTLIKCQTHILPKELTCLNQKCQYFNQLICKDCPHCSHNLVSINKIVPVLNQWIFSQFDQVQKQNKKLKDEWNIVTQNIRYCIDIFQQLLKIIQNHLEKRIYAPKKFIDIVNIVYGMFTHDSNNGSPQMLLKSWNQLQKKYHLFNVKKEGQNSDKQNLSWMDVRCQSLQSEKRQRLSESLKANKKSKQFSQKALAFSQTLAGLIESKVREEQHRNKIKQIKMKNELNLKDLLDKYNSAVQSSQQNSQLTQMLQKVQTFNMQISGKDGSKVLMEQNIEQQLKNMSKLRNLKQLRINNKNGRIQHKMWHCILNYVEMLKFLKDLKLVLTQTDLPFLLKLFKEKENAVRQVESLTLQITDEKQLDLTQVNQFLNTLQLRRLNLNLSRNNLDFKKVVQFLKKLRVYTSLSQLPLIECTILLTANKIHPDEKIQLQQLFKKKCNDVKIKSITL